MERIQKVSRVSRNSKMPANTGAPNVEIYKEIVLRSFSVSSCCFVTF